MGEPGVIVMQERRFPEALEEEEEGMERGG